MKNRSSLNKNLGISLVEVVIAATIIGTSIIFIVGVYGGMAKLSYRNTPRIQADMLAEEGIEAVRTMRDAGWTSNISTLSTTTTYRLAWTGSKWQATTSVALIDNTFDRTFKVTDVGRDSNFNVVSSGGTYDAGSKKVTVYVSWQDSGATSTKSLEDYIFNTYSN
jgi:Tfp pilus assembly protein PilV